MRIAIDIRPFLSQSTGVGVLFENLLSELGALDTENSYLLFSSSWKQRPPAGLFAGTSNFQILDHRIPVRPLNYFWHNYRLNCSSAVSMWPIPPTPCCCPAAGPGRW